jgi:uncharacterized protein YycO
MLSLSAALLLYDTYLTTIAVLNENDRLRRFLNQADLGYGIEENQLEAATQAVLSPSNALNLKEALEFCEQEWVKHPAQITASSQLGYLKLLIQTSPAYDHLRNLSLGDLPGTVAESRATWVRDSFAAMNRAAASGVSGAFSNLAGTLETRKGKLYGDTQAAEHLKSTLKAGDILLDKAPFRLTDRLIPGFWGHAAIWVGTEAEIKALGVWDHPVVKKHHEAIRSKRLVVEALRDGVQMNSIEHFLNADDLAVLRQPGLSAQRRAEYVVLALRQVGKPYDFNFDVETTDELVCSELVYLVYGDQKWPTEKVLGRYTISPDNIAVKAHSGGPLKLVLLYHDGKPVEDGAAGLFTKLLQETQ